MIFCLLLLSIIPSNPVIRVFRFLVFNLMNNFDIKKLLHLEITQLELTIQVLYLATEMKLNNNISGVNKSNEVFLISANNGNKRRNLMRYKNLNQRSLPSVTLTWAMSSIQNSFK